MKTLISCIFVLFGCCALSQTNMVTVSGSIYSEHSALPISHAAIFFNHLALKADTNGAFRIQVEAGKLYQVKLKCQGCKPFSQKMSFTADTSLVFFLNDELVHLDEVSVQAQKDNSFGISRLNNVEGTAIYAGKKSEVVYLQDLN